MYPFPFPVCLYQFPPRALQKFKMQGEKYLLIDFLFFSASVADQSASMGYKRMSL